VDANTQSHGVVIRNLGLEGKVISGGWDLVPTTIENIKDGYTKFVIDQQPYVQGFYPVMALYLYHKYGIAPANMGLRFRHRWTAQHRHGHRTGRTGLQISLKQARFSTGSPGGRCLTSV